jgi:hypothetical protein
MGAATHFSPGATSVSLDGCGAAKERWTCRCDKRFRQPRLRLTDGRPRPCPALLINFAVTSCCLTGANAWPVRRCAGPNRLRPGVGRCCESGSPSHFQRVSPTPSWRMVSITHFGGGNARFDGLPHPRVWSGQGGGRPPLQGDRPTVDDQHPDCGKAPVACPDLPIQPRENRTLEQETVCSWAPARIAAALAGDRLVWLSKMSGSPHSQFLDMRTD